MTTDVFHFHAAPQSNPLPIATLNCQKYQQPAIIMPQGLGEEF